MNRDEEEIRQLVSDWMAFSKAGKVDAVLDLMTDDAVFLLPGRAPMRKDEFARIATAQAGQDAPAMDGASTIREIAVSGDHAYAWAELSVLVTPRDGSAPLARAGHTLTVFRKEGGRWRLARDANLLMPAKAPAA
jgi:uncharacterized protein (TIGR02246 family)